MSVLRVGLLGLDQVGTAYRQAIQGDDRLDLVALADSSPQRTRDNAGQCDVTLFDDCRSLIVAQTRDPVDGLIVALPPSQWLDLAPLAAERGIPVFCHAPVGRTAGEVRTVIEAFETVGVPLAISRCWCAGLDADVLQDMTERVGRIHCAHAVVHGTSNGSDWRGDALRAGGGALLFDGYEAVDALVHLIGVPQVVTADCSSAILPGAPKKYDTEDAAAVALRFGRNQIGAIAVCRGAPAPRWSITIVGASGMLTFDETQASLHTPEAPDSDVLTRASSSLLAEDLSAFIESLQDGASRPMPHDSAYGHVQTLATIEAAYLSSRTGSPETPAQFIGEMR